MRGAVPVSAVKAIQKDVPVALPGIGKVEACSSVAVKSQITGELIKVHFKEGSNVKKGELLFNIDPRESRAALNQSEANLAKDMAQLENAKIEEERYKSLFEKGFVNKEQYDRMRVSREALEAAVRADKAAVENAKIQLGYCSIYSPIEGRTGNLDVKTGNIVKANDTPALITINQISPIYVTFFVPEKYLQDIRKRIASNDLAVEAIIPDDETPPEQGMLSFIDNEVDVDTGTIRLKGIFKNTEKRLWPGQFVNVSLVLETLKNAVLVPAEAVQTGQKGEHVFVVKPDLTVELRKVASYQTAGGETVIKSGINPEELIVTDGLLQLIPGAKVEIKEESAPPQNSN